MRLPLLALLALALAGCVDAPGAAVTEKEPVGGDAAPWQRVHPFDGALGPLATTARHPFEVPAGSAQIEAVLTWREPAAQLGFRLLDEAGEEAAAGWGEAPTRAYVTTTRPVTAGNWTLEVFSERAVAADYAATIKVTSDAPDHGPIATTFVIPPQNPARALPPEARAPLPSVAPRDYAEVNLNMEPGDAFEFSWTATSPVYFNVHYHGADGTTERPIEERAEALEGSFRADMTEVYALLWRNEGTSEVEVTMDLQGSYRLHSMTRRA